MKRYLPFLLCVIAILTFVATLRFEFVYDDSQQIVNDPLIRSWRTLPLLFKTDVWRFWNPVVVGNYWRPLFMVWLLINFKIFGLNPVGWHLTSVLVHALATYLGFRLVRQLTGDTTVAAATSLIFAVHPVHLETVAWVSGVTDSLMSVFFLASLICVLKAWEMDGGNQRRWYALSALLFATSLLCKETAIVLPAVVAGYMLLFPRPRATRAILGWKSAAAPLMLYAIVMALYWIARKSALEGVMHSRIQLSATTLLLTWPSLLWFYARHLLWPAGLSMFYDRPPVFHADWKHFWMPLLGVASLAAACVIAALRGHARLFAFAGLLLLLPLAPAFAFPALVPVDYAHDRYLYLPCLGFAMMAAFVLQQIGNAAKRVFRYPHVGIWATLLVVVVLSVAASAQMIYWANDLLLFDRATQIAPANLFAFSGLGRTLVARGQTNKAMLVFQQVLRIDPNNWTALYNLGLNEFLSGNYRESEDYLARAVALNPGDGDSSAVLADARNHQGKFAAAEPAIRHAIAVRPNKAGYRRVLAQSLAGQGKIDEAIEEARTELNAHSEDQVTTRALLQRLQAGR